MISNKKPCQGGTRQGGKKMENLLSSACISYRWRPVNKNPKIFPKDLRLDVIQKDLSKITCQARHRALAEKLFRDMINQAHFATGWRALSQGVVKRIKRGRGAFSIRQIALDMGISEKCARTLCSILDRSGLVSFYKTARGTIYRINRYFAYHKAAEQGCYAPETKQAHRETTPLASPKMNYYYKYNRFARFGQAKNGFRYRSGAQILKILESTSLKDVDGRGRILDEVQKIPGNPVDNRRLMARAYLIAAGRGRNPVGLAFHLLNKAKHTPSDADIEQAKSEEHSGRLDTVRTFLPQSPTDPVRMTLVEFARVYASRISHEARVAVLNAIAYEEKTGTTGSEKIEVPKNLLKYMPTNDFSVKSAGDFVKTLSL